MREAEARRGRREEGEEEERRGETRGTVSSKRGPNTTGWLGIILIIFKLPKDEPNP